MANFLALMGQAQQIAGMLSTGLTMAQQLRGNFEAAKAGLSETEASQLQAKLDEIHEANLALSAELDANLAALEARG